MSMTNPSATLGGVEDRHAELIRVDHPEYGGVYEVNPQPGGTLLLAVSYTHLTLPTKRIV